MLLRYLMEQNSQYTPNASTCMGYKWTKFISDIDEEVNVSVDVCKVPQQVSYKIC